jgi:exodeoxyribonuclease V
VKDSTDLMTAIPELSGEQQAAFDRVSEFLFARATGQLREQQYMTIQGLAGVGKTFLATKIAQANPGALICAYTGKAANVLRERAIKNGVSAQISTIHSAIYFFKGMHIDEVGKAQPVFTERYAGGGGLGHKIMLLDESSMIGTRIADDILDTGATIIACGDPGQLPPVADEQFFSRTDIRLTEIHRQAWESPIIRQAHNIRNTGYYKPDGYDFQVCGWIRDDTIVAADAMLCWKNKTRRQLNARRRNAVGLPPKKLLAGEPVVCLRNSYEYGIWNGAVYNLAEDYEPGNPSLHIIVNGTKKFTHSPTIEDLDSEFETQQYDDFMAPFAIGYALTVHKFQGSEAPRVLIFDEYSREEGRSQWLYTAVTRAAQSVIVVQS